MPTVHRGNVSLSPRVAMLVESAAAARHTRPEVVLESALLRAMGEPTLDRSKLVVRAEALTGAATLLFVYYEGRFAGLVFDIAADNPLCGCDSAATSWEPHFAALLRAQGATCAI